MADIKGLISQLQESENKFIITDSSTTAERLRAKIIQRKKSEDECLKLKQEIMDFFATILLLKKKKFFGHILNLYGWNAQL